MRGPSSYDEISIQAAGGGVPLTETPDAFGAEIAAETRKRKKVVVFAGLKVE